MTHVEFFYEEVIIKYSKEFNKYSDQVQELLDQVQTLVDALHGVPWEGERASKFYDDWKAVSPELHSAIVTLNQAGEILKQLGDNFSIDDHL